MNCINVTMNTELPEADALQINTAVATSMTPIVVDAETTRPAVASDVTQAALEKYA